MWMEPLKSRRKPAKYIRHDWTTCVLSQPMQSAISHHPESRAIARIPIAAVEIQDAGRVFSRYRVLLQKVFELVRLRFRHPFLDYFRLSNHAEFLHQTAKIPCEVGLGLTVETGSLKRRRHSDLYMV